MFTGAVVLARYTVSAMAAAFGRAGVLVDGDCEVKKGIVKRSTTFARSVSSLHLGGVFGQLGSGPPAAGRPASGPRSG